MINSILIKSENPTLKKYLKKARFSIFQNGIPKILEEVAFIMMPIKVFFDKIESTKAALWWIKPLFIQLISKLKSIVDDLHILSEECNLIIEQFETDYNTFARTELIDTAYSFTSIGRNFFRKEFFENAITDEDNSYADELELDFNKYLNQLPEDYYQFIFDHFIHHNSSDDESTLSDKKGEKAEEEEEEEEEWKEEEEDADELDQNLDSKKKKNAN